MNSQSFPFRKDLSKKKNEPKQWNRKEIPSRFTSVCVSREVSRSGFEFRMVKHGD